MNTSESSHLNIGRYLIPSIADIIFISLFPCILLLAGQNLLNDGDTGWHIRAGEYIIDTLTVPKQDIFSYINPALPWTVSEWLSEVIMAGIHHAFGLTGVAVFFAGLITLTYYLLFRLLRHDTKYILVSLSVTLLVISASTMHWLARPHVFSLLLILVWYRILDTYQRGGDHQLYLLPVLMLVWVNLHGAYIIGFVLLAVYIGMNFILDYLELGNRYYLGQGKSGPLIKVGIVCLLTSLLNPNGADMLLYPFRLVDNTYLMDHVSEFLAPNFHDPSTLPFRVMVLSLLALVLATNRKPGIIASLLLILFLNLAFSSIRHVTLFAIIAAPIVARLAESLIDQHDNTITRWFKIKDEGIFEIDRLAKGYFWPLACSLGIVLFYALGGATIPFDPKTKPVAAVEFLKQEHIQGKMFNDDEFGDYVIYAAWPEYRVFFDGRNDMYGVGRLEDYMRIINLQPDWRSLLNKHGIDWVLYMTNSPLCGYLSEQAEWRLIYSDKVASIFVRNNEAYRNLIDKHPDVQLALPEPA